MDNTLALADRVQSANGSTRRSSPIPALSPASRPSSLMDTHNQSITHVVQVVVNRDERGYGMKVSGDNPVYVQSVKEGNFFQLCNPNLNRIDKHLISNVHFFFSYLSFHFHTYKIVF
jgi:hypothetical protein